MTYDMIFSMVSFRSPKIPCFSVSFVGKFPCQALEAVENEVKSRGQTLHYRVVGDLRLHDKIIQALEEVEHKLHEALENGSDADHGTHGTHAHGHANGHDGAHANGGHGGNSH